MSGFAIGAMVGAAIGALFGVGAMCMLIVGRDGE